jgi:hypothetical protein
MNFYISQLSDENGICSSLYVKSQQLVTSLTHITAWLPGLPGLSQGVTELFRQRIDLITLVILKELSELAIKPLNIILTVTRTSRPVYPQLA